MLPALTVIGELLAASRSLSAMLEVTTLVERSAYLLAVVEVFCR
jgi:hypothetical protein